MSKKTAIVNQVGFDSGGGTTLCLQYAKLGLPVFIKNTILPNRFMPNLSNNIVLYNTQDELIDLVSEYDRLLFVNMWCGKYDTTALDNIFAIKDLCPYMEICYIHCSRDMDDLSSLVNDAKSYNFRFDHVYSLCPLVEYFDDCPHTLMNINAFTVPEYEPVSMMERKPIIFTAGRVEGFKGIVKYLGSIDDEFVKSAGDFIYLHEGASYSYHKNDNGVSCPLQLLTIFDTSVSPKKLKKQFMLHNGYDTPVAGLFNIYPTYNIEDIQNRWKYYFAGISCICGTKSGYKKSNSLLGNDFIIKDPRERTLVEKRAGLWSDTLEYADIEKIVFGVPVFVSRRYSNIIGFDDNRLIYDSFSEIPHKVARLKTCYDDVREYQYRWLVNKLDGVNDNICLQFTKEF